MDAFLNLLKPRMTKYIPHTPTPKQAAFLMLPHREALYGGSAGGGKVSYEGDEILTPFGYKATEDLKVGDAVCNPDGSHARISWLHPWDNYQVWTVEFHDGSSVDVAEEHLWLAWRSGKKKKILGEGVFGEDAAEVISTKELKKWLDDAKDQQLMGIRPNWPCIPLCQEQHFNVTTRSKKSIDPYLLGVLLGDGYIAQSSITITTEDTEHTKLFLDDLGFDYSIDKSKKSNASSFRLKGDAFQYVRHQCRKLSLVGKTSTNKFVPKLYKYGSIETRWAILQGLMDTDGTVGKRGHLSFCTISEQLARDVVFIVQSLGGTATISRKKSEQYNDAFILYIKLRDEKKAFRLTRKKNRCKQSEDNMYRRVVAVKKTKRVRFGRCITVSHPNGLYLAKDFIVTHNSDALLMAALQYVDVPGYSALLLRKSFAELKQNEALLDRASKWLAPWAALKECKYIGSNYVYTFKTWNPDGSPGIESKVQFGYIGDEGAKHRYQGAEYQFCVDPSTKVLTPDGYKKMMDLKVGDYVTTLKGPSQITKKHVTYKPTVKVTANGRSQIQATSHRILTLDSWRYHEGTSKVSCAWREFSVPNSYLSLPLSKDHEILSLDFLRNEKLSSLFWDNRLSQVAYAFPVDGQTYCKEFEGEPLDAQQLLWLSYQSTLPAPDLRLKVNDDLYCAASHDRPGLVTQDYRYGCLPYLHQYDEQPFHQEYSNLVDLQKLEYAVSPAPICLLWGAQENIPSHNHLLERCPHPYTNVDLNLDQTIVDQFSAYVLSVEPYSTSQEVQDITVANYSQYITEGGWVNSNCGFDEVTHQREEDYLYLFTRLRKTLCPVHQERDKEGNPVYHKDCDLCQQQKLLPLRVRGATNPGNIGHLWVKERFGIKPVEKDGRTFHVGTVKERPFIPAYIIDNPHIDQKSYIEGLNEVDPITRERLLNGDWSVAEDTKFKPGWARYYDKRGTHYVLGDRTLESKNIIRCFFTVDPAGSSVEGPGDQLVNPKLPKSHTVISVWALTSDYDLLWVHMERFRSEIPEVVNTLCSQYAKWKPTAVIVEKNGLGTGVAQAAARRGLPINEIRTTKDKVVNATEAMNRMSAGKVWFPKGAYWLKDAEDEIFTWQGHPYQPDDIIDTLSNAANFIADEAVASEVTSVTFASYEYEQDLPGVIELDTDYVSMGLKGFPGYH